MKLAHKIYAVIGIFVLPLAVLALYSIVTGINKDIDFAEKEATGNEYQRALEHVLDHVSQHQILAQRGSADAQARMTDLKAQINRDFEALAEVDARHGKTLQFTREGLAERRRENANVGYVRQAWNSLAGQQDLERSASKAKHFELITLIRSMITHSGDKSNLILDPDLDSYYLMDMTLVRLPVNQERIATALSFGAEVLARGEPTPAETRQLDTYAAMLRETDRDNIIGDMDTSLDEDKNFYGVSESMKSMRPKVDAFAASMTDFGAVLEKISAARAPGSSGLDPKLFFASGEQARRDSFALWEAAVNELDTLLNIRLEAFRQKRLVALVLTVAILIFASFISFFVISTISRSVEKVSGQLHEIAEGDADLTRRISVTGSAELQQLAGAFNTLMGKLRELIKQVQQSGTQVTSSSTEIAASTKQLEAAVTEQAASTNEVVATTKEISATSQTLVQTMSDIGKVATGTANLAGTAQGDLDGMESTMRGLAGSTTSISTKLAAINDKASNINKIVITITKVADQTNLLSLNASIEAEKAGEHGLGFAVVAREIRRLADQTAVATLDIERMVKEMQSAVSVGVMEMDKFTKDVGHGVEEVNQISTQLTKIMEQVQTLAPRFDTVTEGMQAQSQGAQQISSAMVQLSDAARQTMDSLRQTNSAIMDLNSAARGLHAEVSRFRTGE